MIGTAWPSESTSRSAAGFHGSFGSQRIWWYISTVIRCASDSAVDGWPLPGGGGHLDATACRSRWPSGGRRLRSSWEDLRGWVGLETGGEDTGREGDGEGVGGGGGGEAGIRRGCVRRRGVARVEVGQSVRVAGRAAGRAERKRWGGGGLWRRRGRGQWLRSAPALWRCCASGANRGGGGGAERRASGWCWKGARRGWVVVEE